MTGPSGSNGAEAAGLSCTVHFLDESVHEFIVPKSAAGVDLMDEVFEHVGLASERDYFGLQFISLLTATKARMRWLDAKKSLRRQIVCAPYQLFFRVKFYAPAPERLAGPLTRHLLYLQLRRDFSDGKFCSPHASGDKLVVLLASFAAQCELGDAPPPAESDSANYLRDFCFTPADPPDFADQVARLHAAQRGLRSADAQFNFCLYAAKRIALYGLDLYNAKDGNDRPILVGVNYEGIAVLDDTAIVNRFAWTAVLKLSFKRHTFFLRIRRPAPATGTGNVDTPAMEWEELELSFNAICSRNCKMLWRSCVEHHAFFRGADNNNNNKSTPEENNSYDSGGYGNHRRLAATFQRHLRAFRGRKATKTPTPVAVDVDPTVEMPGSEQITEKPVDCGSLLSPRLSSVQNKLTLTDYGNNNYWLTADQPDNQNTIAIEDYGRSISSVSTIFESTASLTVIHRLRPDKPVATVAEDPARLTQSLYEPSPSLTKKAPLADGEYGSVSPLSSPPLAAADAYGSGDYGSKGDDTDGDSTSLFFYVDYEDYGSETVGPMQTTEDDTSTCLANDKKPQTTDNGSRKRHSMTAALPAARPPPPAPATITVRRPPPPPLTAAKMTPSSSRGLSVERDGSLLRRTAGPNFIFVVPVSALQQAAAVAAAGGGVPPSVGSAVGVNVAHRFSISSSSSASSGSAGVSGRRASPIRVINTPPPAHCAGQALPVALRSAGGQPPLVGFLIPESRLNGCATGVAATKRSPPSPAGSLPRQPRKLSQPNGGAQRIRTAQKFVAPPPPPSLRLPSPVRRPTNRISDPYAATPTATTGTTVSQTPTIVNTNGLRFSALKLSGININNNNTYPDNNNKIVNDSTDSRMPITVANGSTTNGMLTTVSNGTLTSITASNGLPVSRTITVTNGCVPSSVADRKISAVTVNNDFATTTITVVGNGSTVNNAIDDVYNNGATAARNDYGNNNVVVPASIVSEYSKTTVPPRSVTQCLDEIIANGRTCAAVDDMPAGRERSPRAPSAAPSTASGNGVISGEMPPVLVCPNGTVVARVTADALRRANMRITGGADCAHPALVSGMGASPVGGAAALSVGDQLLRVNGLDISQWTQADVIAYVRQLADQLADVVFTVRPNVYRLVADDTTAADDGTSKHASSATAPIIDDATLHVADTVPRSDALAESMAILKRALDGGAIDALFEQVYRRRPGAAMDAAHQPTNAAKNRYRDVCPYDATRVRLRAAPSGDYINANHVNMQILSSGVLNRYIATQGPLPSTVADFWWMVWENSSTTVVMLTTLAEKGRVKCHGYWPEPDGPSIECPGVGPGSGLELSAVGERLAPHCHYREIAVRHKTSGERRLITQMQYTAWPDHGVPDNSEHFMRFVEEVRAVRRGFIEPIVVHCSAGIGRTGVLIMMETAVCMIEANEPVYPLDIMRTMRDQRAMLIQTVEQFEFVCRSILRAFDERSVEPLAEYQRGRNTVSTTPPAIHLP